MKEPKGKRESTKRMLRKEIKRVYDVHIRKTGNSFVVTVPRTIMKRLKLQDRDMVEVTIKKWEKKQQ